MSTQPPSGPPHGTREPIPPPPRRPWWRRPPALIGAAVAAIVAVVVLVIVLNGRDTGPEPVQTAAEAESLVKRVALTPADWGSGYARSDPYENDKDTEQFADGRCKIAAQPAVDALAALERDAENSDQSVSVSSTVIVHRDTHRAAADLARFRGDAQRCRTEYDSGSKARWEDVHGVDIPTMEGLDDLTAEEGHLVAYDTGEKADSYYTQLTGRKGNVLMQTSVTRSGGQGQNRGDAVKALSLMLSRL